MHRLALLLRTVGARLGLFRLPGGFISRFHLSFDALYGLFIPVAEGVIEGDIHGQYSS